jgi:hypothetical protein
MGVLASPTPGRAEPGRGFVRDAPKSIALALLLIAGAAASANAQVDSNAIMGFETPLGWTVQGERAFRTAISATTIRTQGSFALAVANPGEEVSLRSLPVASTARALTGVGDAGALFEVDLMLPPQRSEDDERDRMKKGNGDDEDDRINKGNEGDEDDRGGEGSLQLFISCPSRGLHHVRIGREGFGTDEKLRFKLFRPGIYNTMKFPIPDHVRNALGGATFNDLTFRLILSSGEGDRRTFRFDNLRVHSVPPPSDTSPAGYGTSVDLVAIGSTPATQLFDVGIVQVPDSFHLKLGTVGTTTVRLALGYEGTPSFTCTYGADSTDLTDKSYSLRSCTGGARAGDLVGASWAELTIVGGDPSMKIRAQLAGNPVGDLAGGGILPAMPTFWGDFDGCMPAPIPGKVVTTSPSCAAQAAQASQIVSAYFDKVNNSSPPLDWIVTPTPEFARRHGDGRPHNNLTGPPPPPNDPPIPFDQEGHLNQGGHWDAYYVLSGNFDPENIAGTDRNTTHYEAALGAHAVLYGEDVDVADIKTVIDTKSAETTPTVMPASSTGRIDLFLFGIQIPFDVDPSKGISLDEKFSQSIDLPPIQIWIFSITIGPTGDVGIVATAEAKVSGLDLKLTPSVSLGFHAFGGVSIGIAKGGVDAKVDLMSASTPLIALATWVINNAPTVCAMTLDGSLDGKLQISSGGGKVELVATFGFCPFCWHASYTVVKWPPQLAITDDLFNASISSEAFKLPTDLCASPLKVTIASPTQGATLSGGLPVTLSGFPSLSEIECSDLKWSFTGGTLSSVTGCFPTVIFPAPASGTAPWTINLSASHTFTDQFGRSITESGQATPVKVTVSALANGVYITELVDSNAQEFPPSGGTISIIPATDAPQTYLIKGLVVGASGTLSTSFTASGGVISSVSASGSMPTAIWTPPAQCFADSGIFVQPPAKCPSGNPGTNTGTYTITMLTTAGGNPYGLAKVTVGFNLIP